MKEGTNIADHLNIFNNLTFKLATIGVKIEEEEKIITLLYSLHESWDLIVT